MLSFTSNYSIDDLGNRLTQIDKDPVAGDTTWTHLVGTTNGVTPHQLKQVNATGPLAGTPTRTFGYDAAGNTITATTAGGTAQTLTWDAEGHLNSVTQGTDTTSYVYDADGNRLISRTTDKTTLYLPDGTEVDLGTTGAPLATRHYQGIAVRDATGLKWVCSNHQASSTVQIDSVTLTSDRRRMMPYGEPRGPQPTDWKGTKGYVGGTKDDTGYTHLGAREYDPTLGRFISVDPIMNTDDPQQMHGYAYSHNSPVTFSDPSGLYDDETGDGTGMRSYSYTTTDGSGNKTRKRTYSGTPHGPTCGKATPEYCHNPGTNTKTTYDLGWQWLGGALSGCPAGTPASESCHTTEYFREGDPFTEAIRKLGHVALAQLVIMSLIA